MFSKFFKKQDFKPSLPKVVLPYDRFIAKRQASFLYGGLLFCLTAAWYIWVYADEKAQDQNLVRVWVAQEDLTSLQALSQVEIKSETRPAQFVPENALQAIDDSMILWRSVGKGEVVLNADISREVPLNSVSNLMDSDFGFQVEADWFVAGIPDLAVGDKVDILSAYWSRANSVSQLVVSGVEILKIKNKTLLIKLNESQAKELLEAKAARGLLQILVHPSLPSK